MSFKIANRFREAAAIINGLKVEKFPVLLNRIIQRVHSQNAKFFDDEEETRLLTVFGLSTEQLKIVLDGICYIFEQAAFTSTGPEPLYGILLEAGFQESHAKVVGRLWSTEAAGLISKLKGRTLGGCALLDTNFHLNLTVGHSSVSKLQDPTALVEFTLSNPNPEPNQHPSSSEESSVSVSALSAPENEKLCLEFSHPELYSFFLQMERVQSQLDSLNSSGDI